MCKRSDDWFTDGFVGRSWQKADDWWEGGIKTKGGRDRTMLCSFANTPCWEHALARVLSGALESKRMRKPGVLFINIRMERKEGRKLFTFHSLLVSLFFPEASTGFCQDNEFLYYQETRSSFRKLVRISFLWIILHLLSTWAMLLVQGHLTEVQTAIFSSSKIKW